MSSEMRDLIERVVEAAVALERVESSWCGDPNELEVPRRELEDAKSALLARTEAGADDDKSAWCDVHKTHDQCPHTDLAVDESVRLRQLFAASQEQVRVLTEMVERGQKHHERMMKLLHPQDASGDAEVLTAHGIKALDRCCVELRNFIELAGDYDLDEMAVQALQTAIESMEMRKANAMQAKEAK